MNNNESREKLAELCHKQWSGWMMYLFGKGSHTAYGTWVMPKWAVDRWTKQMATPYAELTKSEKDQDRDEADRFIKLLEKDVRGDNAILKETLEALKVAVCWSCKKDKSLPCDNCSYIGHIRKVETKLNR